MDRYDITIGIPTFNRAHYLGEAIESALNQKNVNVQVVVCDNASTDNTTDIIKQYTHRSNFKYIRHNINLGPVANYNMCLSYAEGEYFMILGDDDYLSEDYAAMAVETLKKRQGNAVFFGKCSVVDRDKNFLWASGNAPYELKPGEYYTTVFEFDAKRHRHAWFMMCSSRSIFLEFGGFYNTEAGQASDDILLMQISEKYPIIYVPDVTHFYRVYPQSYGNANVVSMAVSSLQYYIFWTSKMEKHLSSRLSLKEIYGVRRKLKYSLANTYNTRLLHFGPKSFSERFRLYSLYPFKVTIFKIMLRELYFKVKHEILNLLNFKKR